MDIEKDWFSTAVGRKITVIEIAKHLGVSRNTARARLDDGLTSDEIITLARSLHVNPVIALQELKKLTIEEILGFMDSDGTLLVTATPEQLTYQLAMAILTRDEAERLYQTFLPNKPVDDLEQARSRKHPHVDPDDGIVREWDDSIPHAADSSPDEDALREERGEDLID